MAKRFADIIHCLRCERIKAWDEDCSYLGCNPELHWQEATAVEVYSALHPEGVEHERLQGGVTALREALRDVQEWERNLTPEDGVKYGSYFPAFAVNQALAAVPADARGERERAELERSIVDLVVRMRRSDEAKNASYWCALDNDLNATLDKYLALDTSDTPPYPTNS